MKKIFTCRTFAACLISLSLEPCFSQVLGLDPMVGPDGMPSVGVVVANDASFKITLGGFARLDFLYTPDEIGDTLQFVTATIPVKGADGRSLIDGQEYTKALKQGHFNATTSRLFLKADKKLADVNLGIKLEGDFWREGKFRLRHAYGELSDFGGIKGDCTLLFGQTWSAFTVDEAQVTTLDFQGPNGNVSDRVPLITWTHRLGDWMKYRLSIEQTYYDSSQSEVKVSGIDDPLSVVQYDSTWPMLVASTTFGTTERNIQLSAAYAKIEGSLEGFPGTEINGYGVNMGGKIAFGSRDYVRYYASYTRGLGLLIPDLETGYAEGVIAANAVGNKLELLDAFGTMLALEHLWSDTLKSNLIWSYAGVDNSPGQEDTAFEHSNYVAANLLWEPVKPLRFGIEYLWGNRVNKNGDEGDASRLMLTSVFYF